MLSGVGRRLQIRPTGGTRRWIAMTLHRRLWIVLAGLFFVPLVVGALVLLLVVPSARSDRTDSDASTASAAVRAELSDECAEVNLAAQVVALTAVAGTPAAAVAAVDGRVDYATVLDPGGTPLATEGRLPDGASVGALPQCSDRRASSAVPVVAQRFAARQGTTTAPTAVVAKRLDRELLDDIRQRGSTPGEIVLLAGDQVVLSTLDRDQTDAVVRATRDRSGLVDLDGWTARVSKPQHGVPWTTVVAVRDTGGRNNGLFALILIAGAVAAGALVTVVARNLSQPYAEITAAAERVAGGDLDTSISAATEGEAGRLGSALNTMTGELRRSVAEVERSRDDLRDSLERIGDTLTSTHDLDGLLQVVLDTAVVTLQARAGAVLHLQADRLQLVAEHLLHENGLPAPAAVTPGTGVLGRVLSTGESARGRLGSPGLVAAETEPAEGDVLAVPLRSMGNVVAVVALYDRLDGRSFELADEDALRTLANQASIAVDNIHLHHEAQRLSTTDALTGLWNFRYLSMSLAREIERSTRFDRPLAVLMLDLDHFKQVNDAHGHARGDTVLRELAQRVQEQIREVDTFARYGGEEFVVVLPETSVEGAAQLAERICVAVRRQPFRVEGEEPLDISVSIGGAAFPDHGQTPATLMRAADKALYVAKGAGRDQWHVPGADSVPAIGTEAPH
jgi:two-component system cell cycle response regulator